MAGENMMSGLSVQDYAAMRDLENHKGKDHSIYTVGLLIVAAIVIAFFVWMFGKNSNEKVQFATAVAKLDGRIDALEPAVTSQGNNIYRLNGVVASTTQGVKDMKQNFEDQLYELNDEVFYSRRHRHGREGGCGCGSSGGRVFNQRSTYNLASQEVTVDERCANGC